MSRRRSPRPNRQASRPPSPERAGQSSARAERKALDRADEALSGEFVSIVPALSNRRVRGIGLYWPALLLGLGLGLQWLGMRTRLTVMIDPLPTTHTMAAAVAMLAMAMGPWLPERALPLIGALFRPRSVRQTDGDTTWILRALGSRDESLMWQAISITAAVAGGLTLITLGAGPVMADCHASLLQQFYWTNLTLAAMEWSFTGLLLGPTWVLNGLLLAVLLASAQRQHHDSTHWELPASVTIGVAAAIATHEAWLCRYLSGSQVCLAGVLPVFLLSAFAALLAQHAERSSTTSTTVNGHAPELPAGSEGLLWLALIAWGVAAGLTALGWHEGWQLLHRDSPTDSLEIAGLTLALAAGMVLARFHAARRQGTSSGCGMATWAAGVAVGVGATLLVFMPATRPAWWLQSLVMGLPIGYALHYCSRAWLARTSSETLGLTQLASAVLVGLAIGAIVARFWAIQSLGAIGSMTAGALVMMAFGGLLQLYEEHRPDRLQNQRLALVFASLAGGIVAFPLDVDHWGQRLKNLTVSPSTDLTWLSKKTLPPDRRVCLIHVDPETVSSWIGLGQARVDLFPLMSTTRSPIEDSSGNRLRIHRLGAPRAFRLDDDQYDTVYQAAAPFNLLPHVAHLSGDWFRELAGRTLDGGQLVVDVPLSGFTPEAIGIVATSFHWATDTPTYWQVASTDGSFVLRLMAGPVPRDGAAGWLPLDIVLSEWPNARPHSLGLDRLSRTLIPAGQNSGEAVKKRLEQLLQTDGR